MWHECILACGCTSRAKVRGLSVFVRRGTLGPRSAGGLWAAKFVPQFCLG